MGRCQKVAKFDFQSQFSMSKIIQLFLIFFIEEYQCAHFLLLTFFDNIFITKMMPNSWQLDTTPIIKTQ